MKARHHQRRGNKPSSPVIPAPAGQVSLGWILAGLGAVFIIGWLGFTFWRTPGEMPALPASSPLVGKAAATNGLPGQATPHRAKKDEAFSAQVNRGNELLAQGKATEAIEVLTEAVRLNPEDEDARYDLGLAFARVGKFDEAIQQYREALRIFPQYVEAHNNLGNVLMRSDRVQEAIPEFETALKSMPDYASAHNNLGTAFQKIGRTNDALVHFREAAKINPDYWEAHFNVAISCLQQGKFEEAHSEFVTVLRLKPNFEPAQSGLAELERRQSAGVGK